MGREELLRAFTHKGFKSAENKLRIGARLSHSEAQMLYQFVQISRRALGDHEHEPTFDIWSVRLGGLSVDEISAEIDQAFFGQARSTFITFWLDVDTFLEVVLLQQPMNELADNPLLWLYCYQIVAEGTWGISWQVGGNMGVAHLVAGFVDNKEGLRAKATGMMQAAEKYTDQLWAAGADMKAQAAAIEDQGVGLLNEDERDKEKGEAASLQQGALYDQPQGEH